MLGLIWLAVAVSWGVGILGRGYWTPDEPREADLAWRMSWQPSKAVPLLAGEPFCEKPPLAYWMAGAAIDVWGPDAWVARLPNLLYALVTALAVGMIARRSAGPIAGLAAAAAIGTFLLSYQVAIWLATDAPLLAAVAVALLGLYVGFYAMGTGERLRGYSLMHIALAVGFLSKSAAAWMVPVLTLITLVVWERRWRELLRWELYVGLVLQIALILTWVWVVYVGPDGPLHLKVFFWNNLVGRFAHVDAPAELQYAAAHRNSPGKYLIELPIYLWPWTLLVVAAARRAWRQRITSTERQRPVRFALATFVPTLGVLSVAATARNIYLAPALPGVALLLGWWVSDLSTTQDPWDARAMRGTSLLLLLAVIVFAAAMIILGLESWDVLNARILFVAVSVLGLASALACALFAWQAAGRGLLLRASFGLLLAYSALLVGPASQIYRRADAWQDLGSIGRAIGRDAGGRPVILFAPDETTRAFIDMYTRTSVGLIPGPVTAQSTERLRAQLASNPQSLVVTQLPGRNNTGTFRRLAASLGVGDRIAPTPLVDDAQMPAWASGLRLRITHRYALPNGRRYALLAWEPATASR
jgi:4-amino-4-deoxy-L-arabinose transferase-like glycosyltransferase